MKPMFATSTFPASVPDVLSDLTTSRPAWRSVERACAPWGNLAIFYEDFGYAKGLVRLGAIESGLAHLTGLHADTTVVIERIQAKDKL